MKRRNTDDRLRALERAAAAGDPQAAKQLHAERRRAGLPLLPDRAHDPRNGGWASENFSFHNGRGVYVASILESDLGLDDADRLAEEGRPGRYVQVEWDPGYTGGNYDGVGRFAYLLVDEVDIVRDEFRLARLNENNIEEQFRRQTGASRSNIIHYSFDELYAKDEDGDFEPEDMVDDGIAYVNMTDDKGLSRLGVTYQWPAIRVHGSQVGRAHSNPQVQAIIAEIFGMPQWPAPDPGPFISPPYKPSSGYATNPRRRRNMADDQLRALERRYLATPEDTAILGQLLRAVARSRGGAPGMIAWIDALWRSNDLTSDHRDLDVLADAVFESSSYSEDLRVNLEAVERIALAADAAELEDIHEDDRDQDQRAPWWRRERFHDLDFDRSHPHKGGRLYSPERAAFVTVSQVMRDRGEGKRLEHRGWLLVERPIEQLVQGVDAVLVAMSVWPTAERRPISTWSLRRVLGAAAGATTLSPRRGQTLPTFRHAVFVTSMRDDPTDVIEQLAGAPAHPLGGAPRTYSGRGSMSGLWEGALGRPGRVEVMRASGPDVDSLLDTALYHWRIADHPYRVTLDELRATYYEERGGESLSLIWVGRGKRSDETDGVRIAHWNNEQTDPVAEEFEWGESIASQLDLDTMPKDWTADAARSAHDGGLIVVEEWEVMPAPTERVGPYALGNLVVTGVACNERFSTRNLGSVVIGGDRGDVHADDATNVPGGVMLSNARLVTTQRGLTDDEAVEQAVDVVMDSWNSVGEDTFNQARRRSNQRRST